MKKIILGLIFISITFFVFGEDFNLVKIADFNNSVDDSGLYRKNSDEVYDDEVSGNFISIDENGNLFIECIDGNKLVQVSPEGSLKTLSNLSFLHSDFYAVLTQVSNKHFIFTDGQLRFKLIDDKYQSVINVNLRRSKIEPPYQYLYYDFENDVLFYLNIKNSLCSLVNLKQSRELSLENYHDANQTKSDINNNIYKGISLDDSGNFYIDGKKYYWYGKTVNNLNYKITEDNSVIVWLPKRIRLSLASSDESVESVAVHPSGDIYVLRYNYSLKQHSLYFVENTWDSEWRKEWYKKHK